MSRGDAFDMNMPIRLVAKIIAHPRDPKVKHYRGLPPELTAGKDHRELMQAPAFIAIEEKPDGVFLFRFSNDGQVLGDTWHMTIEEAKHQAHFEFGDLASDWKPVPADVEDLVSFVFEP
jgi:hypothetical protein